MTNLDLTSLSILVTAHARQRLRERFFFKFRDYFSTSADTERLIHAQVRTGKILSDRKNVPFYNNRYATEYGMGMEAVLKSGVIYLCALKGKKLVVKTCVKRFANYDVERDTL